MSTSELRPLVREVVVLSNPGSWEEGDNPFLAMLLSSYEPGITVLPFDWRTAMIGRWDVLHVHWVERLLRGRNRAHRALKSVVFVLLLARAKLSGRAIVWTVHNESPHETAGRLERLLLRVWVASVDHAVVMSELTETRFRSGQGVTEIPHGHYLPTVERPTPNQPAADGSEFRLLFFGQIRPYKGVESLIDSVRLANAAGGRAWRLKIAGRAIDPEYGADIARLAAGTPEIELRDGHLPDSDLIDLISGADAVVLPYRRMLNSGAALLALSVGRPILVPNSPSMSALQQEIGAEWVSVFDHPLTVEDLDTLASRRPHGTPDLSSRDWGPIGAAYSELFRSLVVRPRSPHLRRTRHPR